MSLLTVNLLLIDRLKLFLKVIFKTRCNDFLVDCQRRWPAQNEHRYVIFKNSYQKYHKTTWTGRCRRRWKTTRIAACKISIEEYDEELKLFLKSNWEFLYLTRIFFALFSQIWYHISRFIKKMLHKYPLNL